VRPEVVLYVDADRFYFGVEARERPELLTETRPVIISVDPRQAPRAVVTTANDAARRLGINSAMSSALALRRAPDAIFITPRHDLYQEYSRRLMDEVRKASRLVQQNSVDEAACLWDEHGYDRAAPLSLRRRILDDPGLSISLGVAANALVAKMATEVAKQDVDHIAIVPPGTEAAFLAPMPIRALIGVGPKAEARLVADGVATIADLQSRDLGDLVARHGANFGRYLHRSARGISDTVLSEYREAKSISAERTFATDTSDRADLWREVQSQSSEVANRLASEHLRAAEVALKLRYSDWRTITRQIRLSEPTADAPTIAAAVAALLRRHWDRERPVRLLGVRAGQLRSDGPVVQPRLLEA
jgi:DNA polymerase-4